MGARGVPREREPTVRLQARCPKCGKPEARRIARWRVDLYLALPAGRPAEDVDCARCGTRYVVTVAAYQEAV